MHQKRTNRKKRRLPRRLADEAMKKLYEDEELSDIELEALFQSDYLKTSKSTLTKSEIYQPPQLVSALLSKIIFVDTEAEILAYFARHPEMMHSIPPRKFEELVASIFKNNGFDVTLTPESRDGGIDIIAVRSDILTGNTLHLIECKRYHPENKVGIGVVQRMMGVVEMQKANQGLIVTTSDFSRDAKQSAEISKHRLSLNAYSDLVKWLQAINNIANNDKA